MRTVYHLVVFVGDPVMAILGLLMFRYPRAWARMNALASRKEIHEFNSQKQLAHTRQLGILFLICAAFSWLSLLAVNAIVPLK